VTRSLVTLKVMHGLHLKFRQSKTINDFLLHCLDSCHIYNTRQRCQRSSVLQDDQHLLHALPCAPSHTYCSTPVYTHNHQLSIIYIYILKTRAIVLL